MADAVESMTITIEDSNGAVERIELPTTLLEELSEADDASATVVADIAIMAFTGRAHALAHHTPEGGDDLEATEDWMLDRFEQRFGVSYAEATGHSH